MKTLPAKNYTPFSGLDHLCLPIDVGVLIPQNDSVRLLVFVLKQLNVKPLYEAYSAYGETRRRPPGNGKRRLLSRAGNVRKRKTGGRPATFW